MGEQRYCILNVFLTSAQDREQYSDSCH